MPCATPSRLLAITLAAASLGHAQAPPAPAPPLPAADDGVYTLRVYPTLFQVPTIVLPENPAWPIKGTFTAPDFSITLDGGPPFHPTTARLEGDDALDIEILLDASGDQNTAVTSFSAALKAAATTDLHPQDTVSVFALDCAFAHTSALSGQNAAAMEVAVDNLLMISGLHGTHTRSACASKLTLWDALSTMTQKFPERPSRRVILVVSEGLDTASRLSLDDAMQYIRVGGTAVFGLRNGLIHDAQSSIRWQIRSSGLAKYEDGLAVVTGTEGGQIYDSATRPLEAVLRQFIHDLRGRYILEFEAPYDRKAGNHLIDIKIAHDRGMARSAPLTAAIPDPALADDPTVLPTGANAPTFGTQRPKEPKSR